MGLEKVAHSHLVEASTPSEVFKRVAASTKKYNTKKNDSENGETTRPAEGLH